MIIGGKPRKIGKLPIEVKVIGEDGQEYFLTIHERFLTIRPKGARKTDATVETTAGAIYKRAVIVRARNDAPPAKQRRRVKRGLLSI